MADRRKSLASMLSAADKLVSTARSLLRVSKSDDSVSSPFRRMSTAILPRRGSIFSRRSSVAHGRVAPHSPVTVALELRNSALARLASTKRRSSSIKSIKSSIDSDPVHKVQVGATPAYPEGSSQIPRTTNFYTPEMMHKRARLRWDTKIRRTALRFWRQARTSRGSMRRSEYLDFHCTARTNQ